MSIFWITAQIKHLSNLSTEFWSYLKEFVLVAAWLDKVAHLSCSKITGWLERGGLSFFAPPLFLRCRPLHSLPLCSDSLISGQQQELNSARRRTPPPRLPRAGRSCTPRKKGATAMMSPRPSGSWNLPGKMKKESAEQVWEAASCEITESSDQAQWTSLSHYFNSPAKTSRASFVEMPFCRYSLWAEK